MAEMLRVDKVSYSYLGKIPALVDFSVGFEEGQLYALIGANGTGKSTLLQLMAGLIHPSQGRVLFGDREVCESSLQDPGFLRLFRGAVAYLFQDPDVQLFCPTVLDELLFGPLQLGIPEAEARERAQAVMQLLALEGLQNRPSYMLSGGEKKKTALGSILTMNPDILLLDEPTNGLDPRTQHALIELITGLNQAGKTVVISTHDLALVEAIQPRVAVLSEEHRLERIGAADEILLDEELLLRVNLIYRPLSRSR
ncbi:MAG: ABC transporter ATP-binding protein [Candidatus Latescibacteria bacterium]|nr:ABC transporter ATP-binding protein [Candidatus Latescibacterota bacterium]